MIGSNSVFLQKIRYNSKDAQAHWFQSCIEDPDMMIFAIDDLGNQVFAGSIAIYNFNVDEAELGKILVENPVSHGYHATIAAVQLGFSKLHLTRILLHVYENNLPALHIYKEAGFRIINKHLSEGMTEYTMEVKPDTGKSGD